MMEDRDLRPAVLRPNVQGVLAVMHRTGALANNERAHLVGRPGHSETRGVIVAVSIMAQSNSAANKLATIPGY